MTKGLYFRLAWSNLGKNRRYYFPYMLSCTLMVMLHFVLYSLSMSRAWEPIPSSEILYSILGLGVFVVEIFALILLLYTNSFLMKRRKREFGLYNVLGMEKRHIGHILFWETAFAFGVSIFLGILLGCLLNKLAELLLCNLLQFEIHYDIEFIPKAFYMTVVVFAVYALLALLRSLWQLRKARPVELLSSVSAGERQPKANWLLAVLGVLLLGAGYWLAVTIEDPVSALTWFFVAVILVILGTYACFIAGSVALLRLLRRIRRFYYRPSHFITVGSMAHRMRQNGAGLATICILSTMVLVMVSGTASLYVGRADILNARYPREITITCQSAAPDGLEAAAQASQDVLDAHGLTAENLLTYRYTNFAAFLSDDKLLLDWEKLVDSWENVSSSVVNVYGIPLADYNAATGQNLTLEEGEVLLHYTSGRYGHTQLQIGGHTFRVAQEVSEAPLNGDAAANILSTFFVVTPDVETLDAIISTVEDAYGEDAAVLAGYYCFDVSASSETCIQVYQEIREPLRMLPNGTISVECRTSEEHDFYSLFGGLFFLGIFLGFLFLLATALIIYYKQITEGYEDQARFRTLRQVGMSRGEVRKTIHFQILTVFFLPLITAGIHTAFAFPMISKLLLLFALTNRRLLILTTLATFLLFALIYTAVYLLTSRFYYRIVSSGAEENRR